MTSSFTEAGAFTGSNQVTSGGVAIPGTYGLMTQQRDHLADISRKLSGALTVSLASSHNATGLRDIGSNLWSAFAANGDRPTMRVTSVNQSAGSAIAAFATGGVFTNSVVSRPTMFPMGLMGEAGDEAIMPLKRGADGSLGVQASIDLSQFQRNNSNGAEALTAEIRNLREDNRAQARSMVAMQQRMTKILELWNGTGLPEARVTE